MQSEAWKRYKRDEQKNYAICNYCSSKLLISGSSATGLIRHLKSKHVEITLKTRHHEANTNSDHKNQASSKQPKLHQSMLSFVKRSSLSTIVAELAAKDGISIKAITKSDFIRQSISNRGYSLPKTTNGVMKLVKEYYCAVKTKLCERLNNENRFSITLDEWTSNRNRRYMNTNLHHSNDQTENLGLVRIEGSCPAEKAVDILSSRLNDLGINMPQIVGCTTDGAAVMKKFGRLIPAQHQLCYNHGIHLAIMDVFYKKGNSSDNIYILTESEGFSPSESELSDSENNGNTSGVQPELNDGIKNILGRIRAIAKFLDYHLLETPY